MITTLRTKYIDKSFYNHAETEKNQTQRGVIDWWLVDLENKIRQNSSL